MLNKLDASLVADLWIFKVAAETANFSRAGEALSITQSAVTQRIQRLEARLSLKLFERERGGIRATHAGTLLLRACSSGFENIEKCLVELARSMSMPSLNINSTPSLTLGWLTTRLAEFTNEHPDIDVRMFVEMRQLDTARMISENFDVVIRYGPSPLSGTNVVFECVEPLFPVISPGLKRKIERKELHELVLLHDARPWPNSMAPAEEWSLWQQRHGSPWRIPTRDRFFNLAHLAYQSAINGEGIALGRALLVKSYIEAGQLVPLAENQNVETMKYFISTQSDVPPPHIREFIDWLQDRMTADQGRTY
ncbi:LysR substrate-binding domain-containing protein [Sinorhizobium terangae]|uniref:LysR substrate-binding domain-containing protein n=1 Tax=Sinorhizobium terangae TaxID=110322 RepID=UPI0024B16833|nr:LysR substrate-binding domain-containing protein [Sinorhizobium terangae]WFU49127.1 LysR substrate-binding domain-containing protein [Sinorhizobium terangae]